MCIHIYTHAHNRPYQRPEILPCAHTHTCINAHINTNHRPYQRLEILPRTHWQMLATMILKFFKVHIVKSLLATQCTADPIWGDIFECSSKAQSSKLKRLFCHVSVKRDVRALSFDLWKSFRKCHPKWDWQYYVQWLKSRLSRNFAKKYISSRTNSRR